MMELIEKTSSSDPNTASNDITDVLVLTLITEDINLDNTGGVTDDTH